MQSTEDFDSTSSIPVFGSAVTQTKLQQQQQTFNNESGGMEKLVTPPQPVANGESDASSAKKTDDHVGNGTVESHHGKTNGNGDANDGHVNGKHDQPEAGTIPPAESNAQGNGHHVEEATSKPIEKTSDHDAPAVLSSDSAVTATPTAPSTIDPVVVAEPEPSSSTPAETADVPAEPSTVAASQPSAVAEVGTPERPSQSPRGKRKSPAISTPPTRQSARGRKTASPASKNDDNDDDTGAPTADLDEPSPSAKRPKRQAVTLTKDTTVISPEQNAVLEASIADEVNNPTVSDVAPTDADEDKPTSPKKTPSPRKGARGSANAGRKRGASSSPPVSAAKKTKASPRGKKSITSNDEPNMDVDNAGEQPAVTSEQDAVQTPPKKARTSGTRKTPDSASTTPESSGEYARKLRPRK